MRVNRLVQLIQYRYFHLDRRVHIVDLLGVLPERSDLLLQIVHDELNPGLNIRHLQYLRLRGHYHLILPPNGMQDRLLGHIWFFQMGPTLELLPNAPYHQVQFWPRTEIVAIMK